MNTGSNSWKAVTPRERHLLLLALFLLIFLIAFGLYVALFTQPISDLVPGDLRSPSSNEGGSE